MSTIYFHSLHDEAVVLGRERHRMSWLCTELFLAVIDVKDDTYHPDPIRYLLPPNNYLHTKSGWQFTDGFRLWVRAQFNANFIVDGQNIDVFSAILNTALAIGNDVIKLMARLHGQCEMHAYVEGANRNWLAEIIEEGQESKILRSQMGWESVIKLLRSRDDEPVVTSYSITDQFPNAYTAEYKGDGFYELPHEEQWRLALEGLRHNRSLEMSPEYWQVDYRFGHNMNAFDLKEAVLKAKEMAK